MAVVKQLPGSHPAVVGPSNIDFIFKSALMESHVPLSNLHISMEIDPLKFGQKLFTIPWLFLMIGKTNLKNAKKMIDPTLNGFQSDAMYLFFFSQL